MPLKRNPKMKKARENEILNETETEGNIKWH